MSTPSFGEEVKPSVPRLSFTACKRSLNGMEVIISAKLPDNSCPQFHLPLLGAVAWRRLVAKVRTSNQDGTISLKAAVHSCINKQMHGHNLQLPRTKNKWTRLLTHINDRFSIIFIRKHVKFCRAKSAIIASSVLYQYHNWLCGL
jgi:hypothetical protein